MNNIKRICEDCNKWEDKHEQLQMRFDKAMNFILSIEMFSDDYDLFCDCIRDSIMFEHDKDCMTVKLRKDFDDI